MDLYSEKTAANQNIAVKGKVLIAMSGGVDSSVAALLVKKQGYDCVGCTMKLYDNRDAGISRGHTCCSFDDVEDARAIAYKLGMPYYVFNFADSFREKIIDRFVLCYEKGITPNPCIDCNRYMKFDKLFDRADILGCEHIVTGHYARIEFDGKQYILKKAADESKDQSYVLYSMTQEQLSRTLFPLGTMKKSEARQIAAENGFVNAEKPDSQDICFVPDGDYARVVEMYSGRCAVPGNFVDMSGKVLGRHKGIIHYTVGQRKGLGLSFAEPHYVISVNHTENTVALGTHNELFKDALTAGDFNWISGETPKSPLRCKAKIRYRQQEQWCEATANADSTVTIHFDKPQRAITPGQAVVLYDDETVLGGGTII